MATDLNLVSKTPEQLRQHFELMRRLAEIKNDFSFPVRITCTANSKGTVTVPISSNADFEMQGYNISYTYGTASAMDVVSVKFSQSAGNRKWSSDYENLAVIATPGVRNLVNPVPRNGMRQFYGYIPANDQIQIDWANTDAAASVVVDINFKGVLWMLDRVRLG